MIRRFFSVLLAFIAVLFLCACKNTDATQNTEAVPNPVYTVVVQDPDGNPVSGIAVQLKSSTNTYPGTTNTQGKAIFSVKENTYTVILAQPDGYTGQTEFSFPKGSCEVTVVLNASD